MKSWKVDPKAGKFINAHYRDITCRNEGYGIDQVIAESDAGPGMQYGCPKRDAFKRFGDQKFLALVTGFGKHVPLWKVAEITSIMLASSRWGEWLIRHQYLG